MKPNSFDTELKSIGVILHALESLDESQQQFVLKTVTERLKVCLPAGTLSGKSGQAGDVGGAPSTGSTPATGAGALTGQTAKQFLKTKLPKTDVLRIACLAYFLTHSKNQPHFKTTDLTKLNTEAGGTPLSNPSMAVSNATKQNKFLAPVGKGNKQITSLGEDVVDALPDEEAVKAVLASQRKPRKKTAKKTAAKAK